MSATIPPGGLVDFEDDSVYALQSHFETATLGRANQLGVLPILFHSEVDAPGEASAAYQPDAANPPIPLERAAGEGMSGNGNGKRGGYFKWESPGNERTLTALKYVSQ